jgi:hypothetical protein
MDIHEEVAAFLADLGVTMQIQEDECTSLPEVSLFQSSQDQYGIFYRLDLVQRLPHLRVIVPTDSGSAKMELYLVRLTTGNPLPACLSDLSDYHGSAAFERGREAADQHLLYALAEIMKQLFWSGDLERMCFPPEIEVQRLL